MVLNPILLGGVWFIIHRYSVFHTFIWRGWVGGLSQMKLTSFEKNCHILRRSLSHGGDRKTFETMTSTWLLETVGSVASLLSATLYQALLEYRINWEIYTAYAIVDGMLLNINGTFTMGTLKSSLLS